MGQMEMKCILNIEKNISILAKGTQVSDVAHGPLVLFFRFSWTYDMVSCDSYGELYITE
jgi:hypothetical protein